MIQQWYNNMLTRYVLNYLNVACSSLNLCTSQHNTPLCSGPHLYHRRSYKAKSTESSDFACDPLSQLILILRNCLVHFGLLVSPEKKIHGSKVWWSSWPFLCVTKPILLESADAEISHRHRRQNAISCSGLYMSVRVSRILIKIYPILNIDLGFILV